METVQKTIHGVIGYGIARKSETYAYNLPVGGAATVDVTDGPYRFR